MATENEIHGKLHAVLGPELNGTCKVTMDEPLCYQTRIRTDGRSPESGQGARTVGVGFEADIVMLRTHGGEPVPLVTIQVKGAKKGATMHDAMVYSETARLHSSFYPYLRSGLVTRDVNVGGLPDSPRREIDLIFAAGDDPGAEGLTHPAREVRREASGAERILLSLDDEPNAKIDHYPLEPAPDRRSRES